MATDHLSEGEKRALEMNKRLAGHRHNYEYDQPHYDDRSGIMYEVWKCGCGDRRYHEMGD